MNAISVGARIRALRGAESRKSLASKLGISKSALAMYERGERIPRDEVKVRFAHYFKLPVDAIFFTYIEHK